ncbi:MAG: 16S rRNA (cytosine(1402)-N(4))-methyltransferase RsmH [Chitinispirillaceae bacterium]|nr:16S rRNA (cytosine(1402)-N(4))-methyltransferase RsmH [Chitinispirillaceae bacterium]
MSETDDYHTPVLLDEILSRVLHTGTGVYLDGTLGGGGHFWAMAQRLDESATLIGIDRDPEAVAWNRGRMRSCRPRIIIEQARFSEFDRVLEAHHFSQADGILLDLGVSSRQIDSAIRGFSYQHDNELDMRMDPASGMPAWEFLRRSGEEELASALGEFGEVRAARRIARSLKEWERTGSIRTSADMRKWYARTFRAKGSVDLLARIFQALRIAVNDELGELKRFLGKVLDFVTPGGRFAVISYHSLEDRMVKEFMRSNERSCICPPELPRCQCNASPLVKRLTRKALRPSAGEIVANRRARSARLRIAERTESVG